MGAELFHADRQTDMTKLIVALRNYANAPNNRHITIQGVIQHVSRLMQSVAFVINGQTQRQNSRNLSLDTRYISVCLVRRSTKPQDAATYREWSKKTLDALRLTCCLYCRVASAAPGIFEVKACAMQECNQCSVFLSP